MPDSAAYRIQISGEAGDGIISAGEILMKAAVRCGYFASLVKTYPSNIRGGYSRSFVTIAEESILSPVNDGDLLVMLSPEGFLRDTGNRTDPSMLLLVESGVFASEECRSRHEMLQAAGLTVLPIPLGDCLRNARANGVVRSIAALGILCQLIGIDKDTACAVVRERYGNKGTDFTTLNLTAFDGGFQWAQSHIDGAWRPGTALPEGLPPQRAIILDGNQAIALGALHAGCTFYASYPITPATSIGETLAKYMDQCGGSAYQAEDEIAALGSVIGASFAGAKAMTATSGPGLSLMQECIGYASMSELPVVIVDVQRAGPSTGMPTKHSQDDLSAAVYGGHGEGPRIVIAPLTVEDCFHATVAAFNCAEQYQCPVLLLSDAAMCAARTVVNKDALAACSIINRQYPANAAPHLHPARYGEPMERFSRYALTGAGVNPLPVPGDSKCIYHATGVEHDADGFPTEHPETRNRQMMRRFGKLDTIEETFRLPVLWDLESPGTRYDVAVCAWGFTVAATREAVAMLRNDGVHIAALYPRLLYPVCRQAIAKWHVLSSVHIVVEANFTGQFGALIRTVASVDTVSLTAYRGEPFTPREIFTGIVRCLERSSRRH